MCIRSRAWVVALLSAVLIGTSPLPDLSAGGRGGGGHGGGGHGGGGGRSGGNFGGGGRSGGGHSGGSIRSGGSMRGGGGHIGGGARSFSGGKSISSGRSFGGGAPRIHNGNAGGSIGRIHSGNFSSRNSFSSGHQNRIGNLSHSNSFRGANTSKGGVARQLSGSRGSSFIQNHANRGISHLNSGRSIGNGKSGSNLNFARNGNSNGAVRNSFSQRHQIGSTGRSLNLGKGSSNQFARSASNFSQRHHIGNLSKSQGAIRTVSNSVRSSGHHGGRNLGSSFISQHGSRGLSNNSNRFNFGNLSRKTVTARVPNNLSFRRSSGQAFAGRSNNLNINSRSFFNSTGRSFRNGAVSFGRNSTLQFARNHGGRSFSQTALRNSARVAGNRLAWGVGSRFIPYGGFGRVARIGLGFRRAGVWGSGFSTVGWRSGGWGYGRYGWGGLRSGGWGIRHWGITRWANSGWGWRASRWAWRHPWKSNFLSLSGYNGWNSRWAWRHPRISGYFHSGWRVARWAWRHPWRSGYYGLGWRFSRWAWRHPRRSSWLAWGYPGWGWGYGNNYVNIGLGFGGYGGGYGGCGYGGGYGGGYGTSYAYNPGCSYGDAGYGDYCYSPSYALASLDSSSLPVSVVSTTSPVSDASVALVPDQPTTLDQPAAPADPSAADAGASAFAEEGEREFKAGNYEKAATAWRHAIVEDPKNGILLMMLSQALFATGKFDEAAGALQQGMMAIPEEAWGIVPENFKDLYGSNGDYSAQLKVLEAARKAKPDDPGLRFLLGYHYGYLGYPSEAVAELDKGLEIVKQDELASKMRSAFQKKLKPDSTEAAVPVPQKSAN